MAEVIMWWALLVWGVIGFGHFSAVRRSQDAIWSWYKRDFVGRIVSTGEVRSGSKGGMQFVMKVDATDRDQILRGIRLYQESRS